MYNILSPGSWQHLASRDNVDPSQLFLVHNRLPLHSLSTVQSPASTSQGFSAEHLFEAFRTSKISKSPKLWVQHFEVCKKYNVRNIQTFK